MFKDEFDAYFEFIIFKFIYYWIGIKFKFIFKKINLDSCKSNSK